MAVSLLSPFRLLVSLVLALSTSRSPCGGVPVLECVTHHAILEGLGPCMTVCICHVSIEPSYKFLPKLSVGQVALLRLLRYSGVELIEFGGGVEQVHCSWPYGTSDWGCNATVDVSEDILPVRVLKLVQTVVKLYVQVFSAVQQHVYSVGDFSLTKQREHCFLGVFELSCQ